METNWFFYIVRCRDNSYYSGITNNVEHRISMHNRGIGARYTAGRTPVTLVYLEKHVDASEASKREHQVKRWPRVKKERLINNMIGRQGTIPPLV
jgi:putative endonuclease